MTEKIEAVPDNTIEKAENAVTAAEETLVHAFIRATCHSERWPDDEAFDALSEAEYALLDAFHARMDAYEADNTKCEDCKKVPAIPTYLS